MLNKLFDNNYLRQKIREFRKARGISSEKLGEMVGMDGAYIRQIELGIRGFTFDTFNKITEALGIRLEDLIAGDTTVVSVDVLKDFPHISEEVISSMQTPTEIVIKGGVWVKLGEQHSKDLNIPEGSYVYVSLLQKPKEAEKVIVFDGTNILFGKIQKIASKYVFISTSNPEINTIVLDKDFDGIIYALHAKLEF
jgi:transcriptional regulator with XRE-family HTH domain